MKNYKIKIVYVHIPKVSLKTMYVDVEAVNERLAEDKLSTMFEDKLIYKVVDIKQKPGK